MHSLSSALTLLVLHHEEHLACHKVCCELGKWLL